MLSYRTILTVITILSFMVAGLSEIRNSLLLTIALMNICMWTWPFVDKWRKQRNARSVEGERQLQVGNYPEAEQTLTAAVAEAATQRSSPSRRASILQNLAEAQRKQGKFAQSEQSIRQAMALVADLNGQSWQQYGQCLDLLAATYRDSGNYPQAQQ